MTEPQRLMERGCAEIAAIVGEENVRPARPADAVDGVQPIAVIAPADAQQVAVVLRCCSQSGLAVAPRGGGTKLALGNRPSRLDFILSTERLNSLVEHAHDDLSATVEAGCTIAHLQAALAARGQRLAADPLQPDCATVGGIVATAESGSFRTRYGALRDLVLGLELALPDGNLLRAGGKVVKNVAGYDLTRLSIGSLGTLGVITRVIFRLHPIAVATATLTATMPSTGTMAQLVQAIRQSHIFFTGLQVRAARPDQFAVDVRCEGIAESLPEYASSLGKLAVQFREAEPSVWSARENLLADCAPSAICKCSVQPAQLGALATAVFRCADAAGVSANFIGQATGIAELRLDGSELALLSFITGLGPEVARLEGAFVVQRCPLAMKSSLDVWGNVGSSIEVMRRVKRQFDPAGVLNPGRFLGGI